MGWAAMCLTKRVPLTREAALNFQKPVLLDRGEILMGSRVVQCSGGRELIMQEKIYQGDSEPCVTVQGTFGLFMVETIRRFDLMDGGMLSAFPKLFPQL